MPQVITDDMKAVIEAQRLCFAATVCPDGRPNLSPKGTIRVWDDHRLLFCDIASPGTRRNIKSNPWIEINVVDPLSRRGYRFLGKATEHRGDQVYKDATDRVFKEEGTSYAVECVILIQVERAEAIISPGYNHVPDEWSMRTMWRERRKSHESTFEAFLRTHAPPS